MDNPLKNLVNLVNLVNLDIEIILFSYGKIMRCALFEILYLTEVYLVTDK